MTGTRRRPPLKLHLHLDEAMRKVPPQRLITEDHLLEFVCRHVAEGHGCTRSEVPRDIVEFATLKLIHNLLKLVGGEMDIGIRRGSPFSRALAAVLQGLVEETQTSGNGDEAAVAMTSWSTNTTLT